MAGEPAPQEPRWKRELAYWIPLAVAFAALVGIGYSFAVWIGIGSGDDPPAPQLDVHQTKPINRPDVYETGIGMPVQSRPSTPQIAVTVRNRGEEAALLERVRVRIEDSARLPLCPFVGPAGPVPGQPPFYPIRLPWLPTPDELVLRHEMQQEVPAGKVGHFTFFFRTPADFAAAHLYALRLEVIAAGAERPIDLGRFVIGVPGPVPHTGFHLPEIRHRLVDTYDSASADTALATSWCFRRNLADMRRVLARSGRRAPAIAALSEVSLARGWRRLGDTRPARAAIESLLGTEFLEGPALAVFAAEGTGDAQLVARTRRRAAARLSRWAQRGVDQGYVDHVVLAYARQAHRLVPSSRARDLIRALEARMQGLEEASLRGG